MPELKAKMREPRRNSCSSRGGAAASGGGDRDSRHAVEAMKTEVRSLSERR